jgi:hypothetical protein
MKGNIKVPLSFQVEKTQDEIYELKRSWALDPCWDIEDTEGFENYKEDLLAFRVACEKNWKKKEAIKELRELIDIKNHEISVLNKTLYLLELPSEK